MAMPCSRGRKTLPSGNNTALYWLIFGLVHLCQVTSQVPECDKSTTDLTVNDGDACLLNAGTTYEYGIVVVAGTLHVEFEPTTGQHATLDVHDALTVTSSGVITSQGVGYGEGSGPGAGVMLDTRGSGGE